MRHLLVCAGLLSLSAAPVAAQSNTCRTDNPNCQGYTVFGPSAVDRCISIRGQSRTDFCEKQGDTQRVLIHAGDTYCAVPGTDPVPEQCNAQAIVVTEPQ